MIKAEVQWLQNDLTRLDLARPRTLFKLSKKRQRYSSVAKLDYDARYATE